MGGKGGKKMSNRVTPAAQRHGSMTLREESMGKKQGHVNAKTMCKVDHLKNLAVWAATEASIPSLGAFFGERLAAITEVLGIRSDPALFVCGRCESVLQPGQNCTVRVEKKKGKMRHKRKESTTKNNVVYTCHFCSHRNLMRGTPKGYMKGIFPPKAETLSKPELVEKHLTSTINTAAVVALPAADGQNIEPSSPAPTSQATNVSLLESKRRKRSRSSAKKVIQQETISTVEESAQGCSSKRRKKSWIGLKEIMNSSNEETKLSNLAIPFFIS